MLNSLKDNFFIWKNLHLLLWILKLFMVLLPFSSSMRELVYCTESKICSGIELVLDVHQAHQRGSGRTALFSCCSLRPLRVLWGTRDGGHKLPSLLWQWTELVTIYPSFRYASGNHRHQLLEASNHVLWNRLLAPVEDLFNKGKALQIYWLGSASVLKRSLKYNEPYVEEGKSAFLSGSSSSLTGVYHLHL